MAKPIPPTPPAEIIDSDPFAIRSIEKLLILFDGGTFLTRMMEQHTDLLQSMQDHIDNNGNRGAKGSFTMTVNYELGAAGDLGMRAQVDFKPPKQPASQAAAFVDQQGQMTLYSPMMRKMHGGVRDVTPHDPETGEVRDI